MTAACGLWEEKGRILKGTGLLLFADSSEIWQYIKAENKLFRNRRAIGAAAKGAAAEAISLWFRGQLERFHGLGTYA